MKKLMLLLMIFPLMIFQRVEGLDSYTEIFDNNPNDQTDCAGTGYNDYQFTSDTFTSDYLFVYNPEKTDVNTALRIFLYDGAVLTGTIVSVPTGWNLIDTGDYDSDTDKAVLCYWNEYNHVYNVSGLSSELDETSGGADQEFWEGLQDLYTNYSDGYATGYGSGYAQAITDNDFIVDEYDGRTIDGVSGSDTYDDTSYDNGYSDGYAVGFASEIDYSVFTNLLSEMGGLFTMEIMPNITIGMLASIPIAFALFRWFLKIRG